MHWEVKFLNNESYSPFLVVMPKSQNRKWLLLSFSLRPIKTFASGHNISLLYSLSGIQCKGAWRSQKHFRSLIHLKRLRMLLCWSIQERQGGDGASWETAFPSAHPPPLRINSPWLWLLHEDWTGPGFANLGHVLGSLLTCLLDASEELRFWILGCEETVRFS